MNLPKRSVPLSVVVALACLGLLASAASAALPLRVPQVVFNYLPLQSYLNVVDPGINVATDQVNAQVWSVSITGNTDFTLMLETGIGQYEAFGIYDATAPIGPNPPLFQVFPPYAVAGWFAALHFGGGNLVVTLFDQNSIIQGQTFYAGVNPNAFGFYIAGATSFILLSEDIRNPGGSPQMLTYNSVALPGDFWLCFEEHLYTAQSTFDGVVVNVQSIRPVPAVSTTWGQVKGQYR